MTIQDLVIIGAMSVPMLMFSVFPGIWVGDYLERKHQIEEKNKRAVIVVTTMFFAFSLSTLLHFF
ncbi:MAG: hypothetical protein OEL19_00395 [Sulfurimonas sp.]|nr:hypothetical protein [Sulfurimonas sp.]